MDSLCPGKVAMSLLHKLTGFLNHPCHFLFPGDRLQAIVASDPLVGSLQQPAVLFRVEFAGLHKMLPEGSVDPSVLAEP